MAINTLLNAAQAAGLIADDAQIRDITVEFFVDKQNPRVEIEFRCDRTTP